MIEESVEQLMSRVVMINWREITEYSSQNGDICKLLRSSHQTFLEISLFER